MSKSKKANEESTPPSASDVKFNNELTGLPSLTVKEVLEKEVIKLDLGGGNHPAAGYVNVDIQYYPQVDLVLDVSKIDEYFPERSVDAIMCRDTLQCFPYADAKGVLRRWHKILKPRSRFVIQCYDIRQILDQFIKGEIDLNRFKMLTYGRQGDQYTTYRNCFDEEYLTSLLQSVGFTVQEVSHPPVRIKVTAIKDK